ncbi:uncharacterized protein [Cherax quadricarinatus]|uniref:uncharacterized protein n=1 Tax=Cherax quadricarinatus TaxID=27406 RepID=UPI00387E9BB9
MLHHVSYLTRYYTTEFARTSIPSLLNISTDDREDPSSSQLAQHQVTSGDLGQTQQVISGDPGVDLLLATLGDSVNGDQRSVMALLQTLLVDGAEDTHAMDMVRKTHGGRKKTGPLGHDEGHQLEGPSDESRVDEGRLEEPGQPGKPGEEVHHQQMAEFTLEPHLGPAILPFEVPEGYFVPFLPRRAFGVENGVSRPPHGHGSFYIHRSPGLVDVPNSPAFGFLFSGYRRFDPEAPRTENLNVPSKEELSASASTPSQGY